MSFVSIISKGNDVRVVKVSDNVNEFEKGLLEKEVLLERFNDSGWINPRLHILEVENNKNRTEDTMVSILFVNDEPIRVVFNDKDESDKLEAIDWNIEGAGDSEDYRKYKVGHFLLNELGGWRNDG